MAEVEVARDGAVQTITLNRPDVLNAFNRALHKALREALKEDSTAAKQLSARDLDAIFEPASSLAAAAAFVDRVLARRRRRLEAP